MKLEGQESIVFAKTTKHTTNTRSTTKWAIERLQSKHTSIRIRKRQVNDIISLIEYKLRGVFLPFLVFFQTDFDAIR